MDTMIFLDEPEPCANCDTQMTQNGYEMAMCHRPADKCCGDFWRCRHATRPVWCETCYKAFVKAWNENIETTKNVDAP